MKRVLIADDDARTLRVLQILAHKMGLACVATAGADEALASFRAERSDLVITDLRMPTKDGIELLRELRTIDAEVPAIMLTAHGSISTAVEAMKLGAVDYLQKPFDVDALELVISRALELSRVRLEHRFLREQAAPPRFRELIGRSSVMHEVFELVRQVAPTRSPILITGETGTGKDLVARAIHTESPRQGALFVPLNCTAIPSELLESELFGHVRGAFSGAQADRIGRFQAADGGTLFLDEIGDMDVKLQAKLLRVLEEGIVEPLGTNRRVPVDVRIVSSTNRDLEAAMRNGTFREDLYFRLNVFRVCMPPLRERPDDIPALAHTFVTAYARDLGKPAPSFEPDAIAALQRYGWPGNVRELRNVMERAAVLAKDPVISKAFLRTLLPSDPASHDAAASKGALSLEDALDELERRLIVEALAVCHDSKVAAAQRLGIGERTLWTKLKKHGL